MSHFSVLVIGDDVEKQLQPFHEFECTGYNDEFVQNVDVTEECREHGLDWYGLEDRVVASEDEVDLEGEHKYGFAIVKDGELVKAVNRTNPNRKWDWWQIGGRWSGRLKLKSGARVDQATKAEIDFKRISDDAARKAEDDWEHAHAITGGLSDFVTWDEMRAMHDGDIDRARVAYREQRAMAAVREDERLRWDKLDRFKTSRDEFVQAARDASFSTFAVLKDGKWYERGRMGWWAIVSDEKGQDAWNRELASLVENLPDETTLTVVDCHI